jgi:dTDP-4-amino-4,6-dideoxygalactose transaminase
MNDRFLKQIAFKPQQVPLLDIVRDNAAIRDETLEAMRDVFDSGRFLFGPDVVRLEEMVAQCAGTTHAIGCASGSDALLLSLMAAEIGPGDQVIVPSFTFFATASAVWRLGAEIVFVDVDPETLNMSPALFAQAITSKTKAVIPVHLFGQCAEMQDIGQIADRHDVLVVEDAAQAIGAQIHGRAAGSWGGVGCFSFYPTKNLGACGDGGMLTTSDPERAERLRLYAAHGMRPRYCHSVVGINSRLDSLQAAALCVKMKRLEELTEKRQQNASQYLELFQAIGLDALVQMPVARQHSRHVWNQFTIRVPDGKRDALRSHLQDCGVGTEIYYPYPLHQQECFRSLGYEKGSLPETDQAAREVLSLPIFPGLTLDEQRAVVGQIAHFYTAKQATAA